MLLDSAGKNALLLGLFALLTTSIIAGTFLNTRDRIAENKRLAEERALLEVFPAEHSNSMLDDRVAVDDQTLLGLRDARSIFIALQQNQVSGMVIPATARDGYTGDIDMIVGIDRHGTITGVRVLAHRETPGLGDKVDYKKSQWVDGFIGRSLGKPPLEHWTVKKDGGEFDQFTGATITPRAVTQAIARALQYYQQHRDELLDYQPAAPEPDNG